MSLRSRYVNCVLTVVRRLLGLSGFAGFAVLILGAPLNTILVRRSREISKATADARDKRTKVVNELVSEAKFIKFAAAEDSKSISPSISVAVDAEYFSCRMDPKMPRRSWKGAENAHKVLVFVYNDPL